MMMKVKYILLFTLIFRFTNINSQDLVFAGILPTISQTGKIKGAYGYNFLATTIPGYFTAKSVGVEKSLMNVQLLIQGSLIYKVNSKTRFSIGYTYQRNYPFKSYYINEQRFWQQININIPVKAWSQTNRIRIEQRLIERNQDGKYAYSTRLRYQLGATRSLKGTTLEEKEFYMNIYNEFCGSYAKIDGVTYSENWTYAGVGYHLGKAGKLEFGYLLQILYRKRGEIYLNMSQISWVTNF